MTRYHVTIREVWNQVVEVEADSEEEALDKVAEGDGDYLEGGSNFEFNRTMDRDESLWEVEEVK